MEFVSDPPGLAIHVQRRLSDEEIRKLPQGWCGIEAVDELGPTISVRDWMNRRRGK